MSQVGETFFTAIGCMDGRVQEPILAFGQKKFNAKYADTITEAGLVGLLVKDNVDQVLLDSIKKKVLISLEKHHSKGIIIHGHEECAGNPVEDGKHREDTLEAAQIIKSFAPSDVSIIPVFLKRDPAVDLGWLVEEI